MIRPHHAAALCLFFCAALLTPLPARAQQSDASPDTAAADTPPPSVVLRDTSAAERAEADRAPGDDRTPRGALWRGAVLPGWGQFYNRQYYKIPVVYAGLGGILAFALYTNDRYYTYRNAHRFERGLVLTENGTYTEEEFEELFRQYEDDRDELAGFIDQFGVSALRSQRQTFRRYRDLSFILAGVFYALTLVDTYVSAQLRTFDVGEDLSARAAPMPGGGSVSLRVRF